ncbi:hypothetical protein D3C76_1691480 [compost metagenome]
MDGHHPEHPGRRHAAFGQGHLHLEEIPRLQLVAFPARRLEDAKKAGFVEIAQGFGRQLAKLRGTGGTFTQDRHQLAGALGQTLAYQVLVEHVVVLL